jgi:hypothetical protein
LYQKSIGTMLLIRIGIGLPNYRHSQGWISWPLWPQLRHGSPSDYALEFHVLFVRGTSNFSLPPFSLFQLSVHMLAFFKIEPSSHGQVV